MARKKPQPSEASTDDQELVKRVDAMMSTEALKQAPAEAAPEAPQPTKSKKKKPAEPPLVIKLVDEVEPLAQPEPAPVPEPEPQAPTADPLEDSATDQAVDDIVAHEGDTVLAVDDARTARKQEDAEPGRPAGPRSRHWWLWFVGVVIIAGSAIDVYIFLSK